jgi:alcohol dehydrogenase
MELREVPAPTAGHGELLIRVRAAGLNPVDKATRDGDARLFWRYELPVVAGNELAGEVEGLGAGVARFGVGDRVFCRVDHLKMGAFAAYAVVHESLVAKMPDALDFHEAAAVPLAGLTALQALRDHLEVRPGDRVLITGGAGGVGTFAIQLAVWMGAAVATTASARGAELVRSLGAETVVDYETQRFRDVLRGLDSAFDLVGGQDLRDCLHVLKQGRKVVSVAGVPEPAMVREDAGLGPLWTVGAWVLSARIRRTAARRGVDYRGLLMHPSGDDLAVLSRLVDEGHLKPVIDRAYPFERIGEALAHIEHGHTKGKVVVEL